MKITLVNGYPFPYPEAATENDALGDEIALAANEAVSAFEIHGVIAVDFVYSGLITFETEQACEAAQVLTGWQRCTPTSLTARMEASEGYDVISAFIVTTPYSLQASGEVISSDMTAFCGIVIEA